MNPLERWQSLDTRIVALCQQGWYAEAVNLAEEALKFAEKSFGPAHVNVAASLNKLALIYYTQAREVEATMATQNLANGEQRPAGGQLSARSLHRFVLGRLTTQKYALAHTLLNRALTIKKSALGDRHPEVLEIMGNIGISAALRARPAKAICLSTLKIFDVPSRSHLTAPTGAGERAGLGPGLGSANMPVITASLSSSLARLG